MSSGILRVSSLFLASMLILMATMVAAANIKKFILFTDAGNKSTTYVPLDSSSFVPISLFKRLGNHNPIALDYDYVEGRVYWSENAQGRIMSAFLNATSVKTLFRCSKVKSSEGVAIDYVGRNIYWTDTGTNTIEVGLLDGTRRKLLIEDGLDEPRAIVLHLKNSMVYWTDWGAIPKIERAGMDGSARRTIVRGNLGWPNGLTIDLATDHLYWADAKLDNIEKSDLNGGNRKIILSSSANIHPYGPAMFENVLYWTDWNTKSISRFNLSSGNQQIIVNGLQKPMDIHVFDPALIFSGFHTCAQNNGPCSDLCLLKPGGNGAYQCACPTGIQLKADGKSCDYGLFYKTTSDQFMIFADSEKTGIYRVPLGLPETPCYPLGINANMSSPVAVDYDPVEGNIYWSDVKLNLLARAFLNGSSVEVIAHSNVVIPAGLAVDHVERHIYWTDEGNNRTEVARLNGSSRRSLRKKFGERKMYRGGISRRIRKHSMTTSVQDVVVSGMGKPMKSHIYDESEDLFLFFFAAGSVELIACAPLRIPARAHLLNGTCGNTKGSKCVFGCQSGYVQADGNATTTCLETGHWSGIPIYCIEKGEPTSSLAIVLGLSSAIAVLLALLCIQKRDLLIRTWRRLMGRGNVGENNPGYEEMDDNRNDVEQANDDFQNQHNQGRRRLRYIQRQNLGINNQGYVNNDQNSVAGAEELELLCIGRSSAQHDQIHAVSSDTGAAAGSSNSALTDEGVEPVHYSHNHGVEAIPGSDEGPVTDKHCLCIHELVGVKWKKVLRYLSVDETIIDNLDEDYRYYGVAEKCYKGLLRWIQAGGSEKATIKELCDALVKAGCLKALEALRSMLHESNC